VICFLSLLILPFGVPKVGSYEPEKYKPLRLGHPARLLPSVLQFAMENVILETDNNALCSDIRKEMKEIVRKQEKTTDRSVKKVWSFACCVERF
jgi:hypothetical protein